MRVLHLNAGNETGGGMFHLLRLFKGMSEIPSVTCLLGVFEKGELFNRASKAQLNPTLFENNFRLNPRLLTRLANYIRSENITHVHTHGPRANVYMNVLRHFIKVEWIVTVHSDPSFDFREKGVKGMVFKKLHIDAIKNAQQVITVCDAFQPDLIRAGVAVSKMTTIQNGINFAQQTSLACIKTLRKNLNFTHDDFIFLKVARLERVKGHAIAIRAFAQITQAENVHLILVGGGTLQAELESLVAQLNLTGRVHFYGERKDVEMFYRLADVTLLCSFSESFPYVLLEAARARRPVIATDVGDVRYLIKTPCLGWTVKPNDVNALVGAMKSTIMDKNLQKRGEDLYIHAASEFSLAKCAREVYNVYASNFSDC